MQCGLQQSCQPLILLQTLSAYRSFAPSPASSLQTWSNAYSVALCDVLRCANGSNRSRIATGLHRGLLRAGLRQVLPLVRHVRRQVAQGLPQDVPFLVIKYECQDGHTSHGHTATRPYHHGHTATRPYSHMGHTATASYPRPRNEGSCTCQSFSLLWATWFSLVTALGGLPVDTLPPQQETFLPLAVTK
jgi:hypothetical protein